MSQFHKKHITEDWLDLVNEFKEFILEPSPMVLEWVDHCKEKGFDDIPDEENLTNLRYGFECDIGWKTIIREYFEGIRSLLKEAKDSGHDVRYSTFIFKEKFGELMDQGDFYGLDSKAYRDRYYALGTELSKKSLQTCEVCGKPGILKGKKYGWVKTVCNQHAKELNFF